MSEKIERLAADDFDEAMAVMETAFSFEPPRDFPMLLPQIYRPTDELMRAIYVIRREGRIVSAVGVHPREWQVGDTTLKLAGIGGVCTLSEHRGQGLMKALMERCVLDMKSEGFHLSLLGGQRQRYQYYGYEKCGNVQTYALRQANIRHAGREAKDIRFEAMGEHYVDRIALAKTFHEAKPIHVNRSQEDFVLYLLSGYCEPWFALNAEDEVIGYLTRRGGGIREIASRDVATSLDMLFAWSDKIDGGVEVICQPDDVGLSRALGEISESRNVSWSGNWQVYDWATTLDALMKVEHATHGLQNGEVRVGIGEETFLLGVDSDEVGCERTGDTPDIQLTHFEAHRVLFGPTRPSDVLPVPDSARLLEAWAPMPLGSLRADAV